MPSQGVQRRSSSTAKHPRRDPLKGARTPFLYRRDPSPSVAQLSAKKGSIQSQISPSTGMECSAPVPRRMLPLPQRPLLSRLTWSTEGLSTSLVGSGWQRLGAGRREKAAQSLGHLDLNEWQWSLEINAEIPPGAWPMSCFWKPTLMVSAINGPTGRPHRLVGLLPPHLLAGILRTCPVRAASVRACVRACVPRGRASREQVITSRWRANLRRLEEGSKCEHWGALP